MIFVQNDKIHQLTPKALTKIDMGDILNSRKGEIMELLNGQNSIVKAAGKSVSGIVISFFTPILPISEN